MMPLGIFVVNITILFLIFPTIAYRKTAEYVINHHYVCHALNSLH